MQKNYKSWIPYGFDYRTALESHHLLELLAAFRSIAIDAGYREIFPPLLDYAATFQEATEDLFYIKDSQGERLALRSDTTVQIIKAVANHRLQSDAAGLWKYSYCQPVARDLSWGHGHPREIMQAGLERIQLDGSINFKRILALALNFLRQAGFKPRLLYGDTRFIQSLLADLQGACKNRAGEALLKRNAAELATALSAEKGQAARVLAKLPFVFGGPESLKELQALCAGHPAGQYLEEAGELNFPELVFDFALVRDLAYYTGPVVEGYIEESREQILTGGVYDALFGFFSSEQASCAGFAVNAGELAICRTVRPENS